MFNTLFSDYEIHDIDFDEITLKDVTLKININKNLLNGDVYDMVIVHINTGVIDFCVEEEEDEFTTVGSYNFKLQEIV
ncbi:hypothetical protein N9C10_03650 [Flavobacteriaceae bacterium]|nr:hypothetical protein [Flavobacteriaceae bacterium]